MGQLLAHRPTEPAPAEPYADPRLDITVKLIHEAITSGWPLLLYGDYDVDGTMSCVQWIWFFQAIGFTAYHVYIPDRSQGYGVHLNVLKDLANQHDLKMIITMDTGITAQAEGQWCLDHGVTFIVTDHHQPQVTDVPPTAPIVNPKLTDQTAYHHLCGASLTYVIIHRLITTTGYQKRIEQSFHNDCQAVSALATVCDVMPLRGINRRLVSKGLLCFQNSTRPVLAALKARICPAGQLQVHHLGFRIGPLINAAGRLGDATAVVHTFVNDHNPARLQHQLDKLTAINERRRELSGAILADIEALLTQPPHIHSPIGFFGSTKWHPGVVGIAAGQLARRTHKPTWVFAIDPKTRQCRGSVRSMPTTASEFNVVSAMTAAQHLFERFGGHSAAGGFCFDEKDASAIATALSTYAADLQQRSPELWQRTIAYDCALSPAHLSLELATALAQLAPFGHHYPEPLFCIAGRCTELTHLRDKLTQQPKHSILRLLTKPAKAEQPGASSPPTLRLIFFNQVIADITAGDTVECLCHLRSSEFRQQLELNLIGSTYRHCPSP